MSVLSVMPPANNTIMPMFNTDTFLDFLTGMFLQDDKHNWHTLGGLGPCITSVLGRNNTYKSTLVASLISRVAAIYPQVEGLVIDTEGGIVTTERLKTCAEEHDNTLNISNIQIRSDPDLRINEVYQMIHDIGIYKEKHQKEYTIETPFIDPMTQKHIRAWIPTLIVIDSLTELESKEEHEMLGKKDGLDDKKVKMVWMLDGQKKTIFIRHLRKMAERWGLMIVLTAHIGDNGSMDTISPPSKEFQYMKVKDRAKGTGSRLRFLSRTIIQTSSKVALNSDRSQTLYPLHENTPLVEINEVSVSVHRTKNSLSGLVFPFIVSQSQGLLNGLTAYHYLRLNGYYGLMGKDPESINKDTHKCVFYPEITLNRKKIRKLLSNDPKLHKALTLCAQLCFLRNSWTKSVLPKGLQITPYELWDILQKKKVADDILSSRSYWTYDTKNPKQYLHIMQILDMIK